MPRELAAVLAILLLSGTVAAAPSEDVSPEDARIIELVAAHFAARTDTAASNEAGTLLIKPTTRHWTAPISAEQLGQNMSGPPLALPDDAVANLNARNREPVALPAIGDHGGSYRRLGMNEHSPTVVSPNPTVKTVAAFALPGYSQDRRYAVVHLEFSWSMHAAYATYLLERTGSGWGVTSSALVFLV
jgi:hypothetical protein